MKRVGEPIPPEEIFPYVGSMIRGVKRDPKTKKREREIQGYLIKMTSVRYRTFAKKGCKCVRCGIEGTFFAIEQPENNKGNNPDRYHLNLYAIKENGEEVMMTVDHIIPASKGGNRAVDNLQPMCINCNERKKDRSDEEDRVRFMKRNGHSIVLGSSLDLMLVQDALRLYEKTYGFNDKIEKIRSKLVCLG